MQCLYTVFARYLHNVHTVSSRESPKNLPIARTESVQSEYKEYLLRVPVLIKNENVLVEGLFSRLSIVKNLFFLNIDWF